MQFFKYKDIEGKEKVGAFYSEWNEVPLEKFIAYKVVLEQIGAVKKDLQKILDLMFDKGNQLADIQTKIDDAVKSAGAAVECDLEAKERLLQGCITHQSKFEKEKEEKLTPLELQAISLMCDVSPADLALMPKGDINDIDTANFNGWIDANFNTIAHLHILLNSLNSKSMPTKPMQKFYWQTKTDAEILELEAELKEQGFYSKMFGKGKELKNKLNAAVKGEFEIKDIWQHSTYANSQFQQTGRAIVAELQNDKWDNAPALICMLCVETAANEKVLKELQGSEGASPKEYLELYATAYKKVFERNKALFFEQKQKLTLAHVIGIRNFFLNSPQK